MRITRLARGRPRRLLSYLCLAVSLISMVLDNVTTVIMIPIIQGLEAHGVNITPLWWALALALGVGLGGNGTHIGATANIIVVNESEKTGQPEHRITPGGWLRKGLPVTLVGLILASLLLVAGFSWFE